MPVDVFVAYVDTFIGKQLLEQFEASPHLFRLHGCTWSADAAQHLNDKVTSRLLFRQQLQQQTLGHDVAAGGNFPLDISNMSSISPNSTVHEAQSGSHSTIQPPAHASPGASPTAGAAGTLPYTATSNNNNASSTNTNNGVATATNGVQSKTFPRDAAQTTAATLAMAPPALFFSRHDRTAVRAALATCEWIVVEQRQSQEVLDMLSCVQQGLFDRPKRFVLLSSFMTWYATPPLAQGGADDDDDDREAAEEEAANAAAAAMAQYAGLEEDREDGDEEEEGDVGADVTAPYPPPPEPTSDADEEEEAKDDTDKDFDNEEEEDEQAAGANGAAKEVFTEDQYNRRVPHVKFYNWRDAEKAVAAAHHANGLPLDTYVVFAGLPYGEGEDLLEPFFRQAWAGLSATDKDNNNATTATAPCRPQLPIYGSGEQRVPMMHVRDLATLTRKLLHRPATELTSRYIFATDGARPTWRSVMETVNKSFGGQCELVPVSAAKFPLHTNVEQYTVDLRVERGVAAALMEEMTFEPSEGDLPLARKEDTTAAAGDFGAEENSNSHRAQGGEEVLWIAEGGLRRHTEKVAREFCRVRKVTPLRLLLQGPPLAGKKFVGDRLAAFYRLPSFSIDDVVSAYKAALAAKRTELSDFHTKVIADELLRRRTIKKRRLLNALRRNRKPNAGKDEDDEDDNSDAEDGEDQEEEVVERKGSRSTRGKVKEVEAAAQHKSTTSFAAEAEDGATAAALGEPDAAALALTEEEAKEAQELMEERFETSTRVARWRREIAEMERVLLMRLRVPPPAEETGAGGSAGPMKKRSAAAAAAAAAAKSKKLTKEQQRRKELEELQHAKEALKDAPFQDKALAIMLRWRLDHADCRTQGYVLYGFPRTVAQARLAFGSEELAIPRTEEEALNPPPEAVSAQQQQQQQQRDEDGDEDGEVDPLAGLSSEPCNERRLPDVVLVLEATENYLLDRLAALSALRQEEVALRTMDAVALNGITSTPSGSAPLSPTVVIVSSPKVAAAAERTRSHEAAAVTPPSILNHNGPIVNGNGASPKSNESDFLRRFNEHLHTFQAEFIDAAYSMLSYWECAVTEAGRVTGGGRKPAVHLLTVHECEPLVPPPPPASTFELIPPCATELACWEVIGAPHYFGRTPLEVHREELRKAQLADERAEAERLRQLQAQQRDAAAYQTEAHLREVVNSNLLAVKAADLAALEDRKAPLKVYLMESVIPLVSKGLLEVAARRPENPLEYLSEWLMRHNPNNDVFVDL